MPINGYHILVMDNDTHQLDTICRGLRLFGHRCLRAPTIDEARALLESGPVDLVIVDGAKMDAVEIESVRGMVGRFRVLVLSGFSVGDPARLLGGAVTILKKPFDAAVLDAAVRVALGAVASAENCGGDDEGNRSE